MANKVSCIVSSRICGLAGRLVVVAFVPFCSLAGSPSLSFVPVGGQGFDVLADGVVVAPIRLAANGAIVADQVTTNATSITFSSLRAKDSYAVVFGANDYVSLTLPTAGLPPEPVVQFQLTFQAYRQAAWNALFPTNQPAPFHFLACSMPTARVWHQRGWLNATPVDDPFPLCLDPHNGTPEIACSWNRNWGYICPLGGHPIPMIGLWDPSLALYVGYDFQASRAGSAQSERDIATVYGWQAGASSNFVALAYPAGGSRFGRQVYPHAGDCIASSFSLVVDTALPATEDPNEQFQARLFARYTNALPRVPPMNDLAWIPGHARCADFLGSVGPQLYDSPAASTYYPTGTVQLVGFTGHREMPVEAWLLNGYSLSGVRKQVDRLLTNYARVFTVDGDTCLYWLEPLEGAWLPAWGGTNVSTLHNSEGWFAGRVLVELYRYDRARGKVQANYLPAIDGLFNWAKHFVWTRGEFSDVPSSPFAVGATLSASFLLDYCFTFKDDPVRGTNAPLALHLARNLVWRYLSVWAMDSNFRDGALDSAFLAEPNSGRDWAALGCSNEMSWMLDILAQVYVHTGDERMRYYLRGMLQRWPSLYRPSYEPSLAAFGKDAFSEGYGLFAGSGPGPGGHYPYGFTEPLALTEPVGDSTLRVVAGAAACIAFNKGGTASDVTDYRTDGAGACSFRVVSSSPSPFDLSFSYPFVNVHTSAVARVRGGQVSVLGPGDVRWSTNSPSSIYFAQVQDGDVLTVGSVPSNAPPFSPDVALVYAESAVQPVTNGGFVTLPWAGNSLLSQDWTDFQSFAGIVPGLHWVYGVPYQQRLSGATNVSPLAVSGAFAVLVAYSPPEDATLSQAPVLLLEGGASCPLSGAPVMAWRGWPTMFNRMVLLDYALVSSNRPVAQVAPRGCWVMGATAFMADSNAWQSVQSGLASGAAAFFQEEQGRYAQLALQSGFAQLPPGRIALLPALLPFDVPGPALTFACTTGLRNQWVQLTAGQLVDTNDFNASRFPLAFYVGDDDYVAKVNTNGDGKAAVIQYLAGGGTLVVMSQAAFPFLNACDAADDPGVEDPLLPALGLPLVPFNDPPAGLLVQVNTNQVALPMLPAVFPFPQGGQRCLIDPTQVSSEDRYVSWLSVSGGSPVSLAYGDAAGCIEFGHPPAQGGRVLYVSDGLLFSAQAQTVMADVVCWLLQELVQPGLPRVDSIARGPGGTVLSFQAQPNLAYRLEFCGDLRLGPWSPLADVPGVPTNRCVTVTDALSPSAARFYRLAVRP